MRPPTLSLRTSPGWRPSASLKGKSLSSGSTSTRSRPIQPLDGVDGVGGVGEQNAAGGVADRKAVGRVLIEGDHRGHDRGAVFAGDDGRGVALHKGDEGVGGAEIDADDALLSLRCFWHENFL